MSTTALLTTLVFAALTAGIEYIFTFPQGTTVPYLLTIAALLSLPVVIPSTFIVNTLIWYLWVPADGSERRGAVAGAIGVAGTYLVSTILAIIIALSQASTTSELVEAVVAALIIVVYAFVLTAVFTFPIGAVTGWKIQSHVED